MFLEEMEKIEIDVGRVRELTDFEGGSDGVPDFHFLSYLPF